MYKAYHVLFEVSYLNFKPYDLALYRAYYTFISFKFRPHMTWQAHMTNVPDKHQLLHLSVLNPYSQAALDDVR